MIDYFMHKYTKTYKLKRKISPDALEVLLDYPFPGNVRELKNILKRAIVMSEKEILNESITKSLDKPARKLTASENGKKYKFSLTNEVLALERAILKDAIARSKSTREMANYLGVSQPTVVRKMRKHRLAR